jgi:hypothetical protein
MSSHPPVVATYDPFQVPQNRIHFFKKVHLRDYPAYPLLDFTGNVYMAIFQDGANKLVVNWPSDLQFIPHSYSPDAYILLHYTDANNPPTITTRDSSIDYVSPLKWHDSIFDETDEFDNLSLRDGDYITHRKRTRGGQVQFTNQITLTLPKWTVYSSQ